jgi:hypothetical protein
LHLIACYLEVIVAMAAGRVLVVVLLSLCAVSAVLAFEKEVKPNNYANFEFHESTVQDTAEVKPQQGFEFAEEGSLHREYKPNNYKDFKFSTEEGNNHSPVVSGEGHDQFAKGQYNSFDASDRFPASEFPDNHETFTAQDSVVFDAHQGTQVFYKTGDAEYRGSDASNRYPSSYDLINARENENKYESFADNEVRFTNEKHAPVSVHTDSGSTRFYTPASDPDFAFRFAKPDTSTFGEKTDNKADENAYSQFNFDNSEVTNDLTATYGSTTPVLAASNVKKQGAPVVTAGHGCANMYWAEHTQQWPSFFSVNTQVAQAFGLKAGDVYGTTTMLQALYDNRQDGYSQLLSHGTAALMNAYVMPNYALRHDAVIDQFVNALSSRTAAGAQAQKFLNANHVYGPNECLN